MSLPLTSLPSHDELRKGLLRVLEQYGIPRDQIGEVRRVEHDRVMSYPAEIVECSLTDGRLVRLFCKYSGVDPEEGHGQTGHGHWGGVEYEAEVYRQVLQRLSATTPTFYGAHRDDSTGQTCLFIQYLEGSCCLNKYPESAEAIVWAASWLGRFHAANELSPAEGTWPFLKRYDASYYLAWARRTADFAGRLHDRFRWLHPLCERFGEAAELLLSSPQTVIHAEYYPRNIICHGETIFPIDWESAAVAAGEIDLAAMTENWGERIVRRCRHEYQRTRWPGGPPATFNRTFLAAQVFLHLRWLGDLPECAARKDLSWRFKALRCAGLRLGVI